MKKVVFLTLFVFANSLLDSCATDDFFEFDLELTDAGNVSMKSFAIMQFGDTVAANDYAIRLLGVAEIQLSEVFGGFGSKLMADAAYGLADPVSAISIISISDLDPGNPAGTELKNLFELQEVQQICIGDPEAASDCVTNYSSFDSIGSLEQGFNDRLATGFVEREGSLFLLKLIPAGDIIPAKQSFTVSFLFHSGKTVQLITPEVFIE